MFRHYRQYIRMHLCKTYFYVYRVCLLLIHLHLFSKQRYFPTGVCPCGILTPHFILNSLSSTTADIFCPNSCQSFRRRVLSSSLVTRIGPAFLDKPQSFLWTVSKPSNMDICSLEQPPCSKGWQVSWHLWPIRTWTKARWMMDSIALFPHCSWYMSYN